jgi:beta-glucosidase
VRTTHSPPAVRSSSTFADTSAHTIMCYVVLCCAITIKGANYVRGAVMFPHNIGLAAAWEPHLVYLGAKVTAKDTRYHQPHHPSQRRILRQSLTPPPPQRRRRTTRTAGIPWAFTPVLGLGIQPLWPRFYETVRPPPPFPAHS